MDLTSRENIGKVLVGIAGLIVLTRVFSIVNFWAFFWPFFILVPGALMLWAALRGDGPPQLAIPGSLVAGTGLILFVQNVTGHWESWAYAWALYPVFSGLAVSRVGMMTDNVEMQDGGRVAMRSGLWMLAAFGLFFELLIFDGLFGVPLMPLMLIAVGLYLWLYRDDVTINRDAFGFGKGKRKPKNDESHDYV